MKNAEELYIKHSGLVSKRIIPEKANEIMWVDFIDIMPKEEFKKALSEYDSELISEIEKKIEEEKTRQTNLLEGFEYQNSDGRIEAFIETINLIKET